MRAVVLLRDLVSRPAGTAPAPADAAAGAKSRSPGGSGQSPHRGAASRDASRSWPTRPRLRGPLVGASIQLGSGSNDPRLLYPLMLAGAGIGLGASYLASGEWEVGTGDAWYWASGVWWPTAAGHLIFQGRFAATRADSDRWVFGVIGGGVGATLATLGLAHHPLSAGGAIHANAGGALGSDDGRLRRARRPAQRRCPSCPSPAWATAPEASAGWPRRRSPPRCTRAGPPGASPWRRQRGRAAPRRDRRATRELAERADPGRRKRHAEAFPGGIREGPHGPLPPLISPPHCGRGVPHPHHRTPTPAPDSTSSSCRRCPASAARGPSASLRRDGSGSCPSIHRRAPTLPATGPGWAPARRTPAGRRAVKGDVATLGDAIELDLDETAQGLGRRALDPAAPLEVVLETPLVVVLDKPAGQPTAPPLDPGERGTLANALLGRYPALAGIGFSPREPGLCHRLDTGTSGLVLAGAHRLPAFNTSLPPAPSRDGTPNRQALPGDLRRRRPARSGAPSGSRLAPHPKRPAARLRLRPPPRRGPPRATPRLHRLPEAARARPLGPRRRSRRPRPRATRSAPTSPPSITRCAGDALYGGPPLPGPAEERCSQARRAPRRPPRAARAPDRVEGRRDGAPRSRCCRRCRRIWRRCSASSRGGGPLAYIQVGEEPVGDQAEHGRRRTPEPRAHPPPTYPSAKIVGPSLMGAARSSCVVVDVVLERRAEQQQRDDAVGAVRCGQG